MSLIQEDKFPPFQQSIFKLNNNLKEKNIPKIIDELKSIIISTKLIIPENIKEKVNYYFEEINNILNYLVSLINSNISQNESLKRKDEQTIRILYSKYFNQKLINEILENKISILNKKEKEYELLKQKTGAIVCNGEIICNERKDNEIIILRTENSLLKNAIKNNEDLLKEKNDIINNLNKDILIYKSQINELHKIKNEKFSSFSNINININEAKKDSNHKNIKSNNNSFINLIQSFPSNKNNLNFNSKNEEINNGNNIFSSLQIKNKFFNRLNNSKNKNIKKKKEEISKSNIISKNINENETIDSLDNKNNSIKYISVNKSLFSPKYGIGFHKTNNIDDNNRINKNKYLLNKNNLLNREYKTITLESHHNNKEIKIRKTFMKNKLIIKHRKANSIQWPEKSLKNLILEKKENSLSNNSHNNSAIRKFFQIKEKSLKNKNNKSLPYSIRNSLTDRTIKNNKVNSQKFLNNSLKSYADKRKDNRGRNNNSSKIGEEYIKNNSLNFFKTTFINRMICDNYLNNEINNFNMTYNNSIEISKNIN